MSIASILDQIAPEDDAVESGPLSPLGTSHDFGSPCRNSCREQDPSRDAGVADPASAEADGGGSGKASRKRSSLLTRRSSPGGTAGAKEFAFLDRAPGRVRPVGTRCSSGPVRSGWAACWNF